MCPLLLLHDLREMVERVSHNPLWLLKGIIPETISPSDPTNSFSAASTLTSSGSAPLCKPPLSSHSKSGHNKIIPTQEAELQGGQRAEWLLREWCVSAEMPSASAKLSFHNTIHFGKTFLKKLRLLKTLLQSPTAMISVHFSFTSIIQGALLNSLPSLSMMLSKYLLGAL